MVLKRSRKWGNCVRMLEGDRRAEMSREKQKRGGRYIYGYIFWVYLFDKFEYILVMTESTKMAKDWFHYLQWCFLTSCKIWIELKLIARDCTLCKVIVS